MSKKVDRMNIKETLSAARGVVVVAAITTILVLLSVWGVAA
jgi:hypothetical protein